MTSNAGRCWPPLARRGLRLPSFGEWSAGTGKGMKVTWKPDGGHGTLSSKERRDLPDSAYAFPDKRKEPLTDARHVQNALARFDQVHDVSDAERDLAFANIKVAAEHFGIRMKETSWRQLGSPSRRADQTSRGE